jgi:hypothetical protein
MYEIKFFFSFVFLVRDGKKWKWDQEYSVYRFTKSILIWITLFSFRK